MRDVTVEDIYIGNGVSELIVQAMQALLNSGDEMLVPAPDYPLWTAAVSLSGGNAVHYLCDESSDWFPDWMISRQNYAAYAWDRHHQPQQPNRRCLF